MGAAAKPGFHLRPARAAEAEAIAHMSRDLIENGLNWSWTPPRIREQIRRRDAVVLTARDGAVLAGFAIMGFGAERAHLNLLAVAASRQRRGIGAHLLAWLEASAWVAGIAFIQLEVRARNRAARDFYRAAGYEEVGLLRGYYRGREHAVRMARFLRLSEGLARGLPWRPGDVPAKSEFGGR